MASGVDGEMGGGDAQFAVGAKLGGPTPCSKCSKCSKYSSESRSLLAHKPHCLTQARQSREGLLRLHRFLQRRQVWYFSRPVAEPPHTPCPELTRYVLCTSTKHSSTLICNFGSLKLYLRESFLLYPLPPPFMVKGVPATQKAPCGFRGSPLHRECIHLGLHSLTAYTIIGAWTSQASTILMSPPLQ